MIGGEKRKRECAEVEWKGGRVREREREGDRGVHNPSCPPQLSGARQARDVGGNPCITALAKER